jgi:hypothetical protein
MPNNIRQANYYLRVEGKLPTGELKFSNQSTIIFQQKAVSIIIQLDRPEYRQESICKNLISIKFNSKSFNLKINLIF